MSNPLERRIWIDADACPRNVKELVFRAGERLELTHRAADRRIYARGALHAARWLAGRPPRLYRMADVLGLAPREA